MEIKLNESQINEIQTFLESILLEDYRGKELINLAHVDDGCEMILRASNKWKGALGVLHSMGFSVEVGEYNEVTLKKTR